MIKVDKKIPMPKITKQGVKKYPFNTMRVGESFLFEHEYPDTLIACQRIGAISATWVKRNNSKRKFSCRTIDGNIRVWRIK
jgi:hypothetical protein